MIKKLVWLFVLVVVLFVLAIFKAPDLAKSIAKLGGFESLPDSIIEMKGNLDGVATNMPSQEELKEKYNSTLSGAIELKETVVDGVQITKGKVDEIRGTLSGAEQTIEDLKEGYSGAVQFIGEASQKLEETKKIIEDTTAVIENVQNSGQ